MKFSTSFNPGLTRDLTELRARINQPWTRCSTSGATSFPPTSWKLLPCPISWVSSCSLSSSQPPSIASVLFQFLLARMWVYLLKKTTAYIQSRHSQVTQEAGRRFKLINIIYPTQIGIVFKSSDRNCTRLMPS